MRKLIATLEIDLSLLDSPRDDLAEKLANAKSELEARLIKTVERKLLYLQLKYFENGDKADRLLPYKLQLQTQDRVVDEIRDPSDNILTEPWAITECFGAYYTELYAWEKMHPEACVENYLTDLPLPSLLPDQKQIIDERITPQEVITTIQLLPSGKAQGGMDFR